MTVSGMMTRELVVDGFTGDAAGYEPVRRAYVIAFDTVALLSIVCLFTILATAYFAPSIRRTGTWFAFLGSWLITSISYVLLIRQQIGPPPDRGLCLFQAMLIYSNPVLSALTSLSFILELGVMNPQWVRRDPSGLYCHLSKPIALSVTSAIVIACMVFLLLLEALVAFTYYRNWKITQEFKELNRSSVNFSVTVRFVAFNIGVFFALTFGFWSFVPKTLVNSARLDLALGSLPLIASIVFGSHKDFFRVWFPCLQDRESQKNNLY
ncbi:hypothetical protein CVT24_000339 [Panaeolus cyanescens]|uniref:Uncharacterized protein n=1 Tax=Panaeolus cyanescens TaxID=181874 RepID=A0A409VJ29_9AGAR|nr:hypothetical protein CVT24_000339 [Panaeolus cyanescens]